MVIEWLSYRVPVGPQARFRALDTAIWTAALAGQPGYMGSHLPAPSCTALDVLPEG